jgi:hypothetical protein
MGINRYIASEKIRRVLFHNELPFYKIRFLNIHVKKLNDVSPLLIFSISGMSQKFYVKGFAGYAIQANKGDDLYLLTTQISLEITTHLF